MVTRKMVELTEEEKNRIIHTPIEELLETGDWVKLYDAIDPIITIYAPGCFEARDKAIEEAEKLLVSEDGKK